MRTVDSVLADIDAIQQRISALAAEMFRERGTATGHAVADWLTAEQETIWRPAIEVQRSKGALVFCA